MVVDDLCPTLYQDKTKIVFKNEITLYLDHINKGIKGIYPCYTPVTPL